MRIFTGEHTGRDTETEVAASVLRVRGTCAWPGFQASVVLHRLWLF